LLGCRLFGDERSLCVPCALREAFFSSNRLFFATFARGFSFLAEHAKDAKGRSA